MGEWSVHHGEGREGGCEVERWEEGEKCVKSEASLRLRRRRRCCGGPVGGSRVVRWDLPGGLWQFIWAPPPLTTSGHDRKDKHMQPV